MVDFFLVVALALLLQGLASLAAALRFLKIVRGSVDSSIGAYSPQATVIAPHKGLEPGLEERIALLLNQDYPSYEVVFVIASAEDRARGAIENEMARHPEQRSRLVVAGLEQGRSQKVNNLMRGVGASDTGSEVLAFIDSDASPGPDWLKSLIAPLQDMRIGGTTGYRWYLTKKRGVWNSLLSAWNASVATTLADRRRRFVWGGSAAIRRETFESLGIKGEWEHALSDDYSLTRAIRSAGLEIEFVPRCLVTTAQKVTLSELLEFSNRQITITRVYRPGAWWAGLASFSLFTLGFFGGGLFLAAQALGRGTAAVAQGPTFGALALLLSVIYILGSAAGYFRLRAASLMLARLNSSVEGARAACLIAWPVVALLFLVNFVVSATTRRITWRGVRYEMPSARETVVLDEAAKWTD